MDLEEKKKKMIEITIKENNFYNTVHKIVGNPYDLKNNIKTCIIIKCLESGRRAEEIELSHTDLKLDKADYEIILKKQRFNREGLNKQINDSITQALPDMDIDSYIEYIEDTMEEEIKGLKEDGYDFPR